MSSFPPPTAPDLTAYPHEKIPLDPRRGRGGRGGRRPAGVRSTAGARIDDPTKKAAGLDDWLFKPVLQARLYDCLTRCMAVAPAASRPPFPLKAVTSPLPPVGSLRILLAEDNAVNQKVALGQLRKLGHTATVAGNGREALEAQQREAYDVILMDGQMPEMEGYEASRRIRLHESTLSGDLIRPVYIIAMTAHALEGDREKCLAAGMDDYLSKPVNLAELEAALARAAGAAKPCLVKA